VKTARAVRRGRTGGLPDCNLFVRDPQRGPFI